MFSDSPQKPSYCSALLEGSMIQKYIQHQIKEVQDLFDLLKEEEPQFLICSYFQSFMRVYLIVKSRIFGILLDNEFEDQGVMVPFGDMMNHSHPHNIDYSFS